VPSQQSRQQKKQPKRRLIHNKSQAKMNDFYYKVIDLKETIYTNQTDQFPHLSSKGNMYVMVAIHIDANYIAMEPMKNGTEIQIITAYQNIVDKQKAVGMITKKHILDNECSEVFKKVIKTM